MASITQNGAPNRHTIGQIGDIYTDSNTNEQYTCVAIYIITTKDGVIIEYEWDEVPKAVSGGDGSGVSPTITVSEINGGHYINITDVNGIKQVAIMDGVDGSDGEDGVSPTIVENSDNNATTYKLDITDVNGKFTTPNLMGQGGEKNLYTSGTGIQISEDKVISIKEVKKNYIDNSNFRINQTGQSEYTVTDGTSIYTVDRWYIDGGSLIPVENGIQFVNPNTAEGGTSSLIRLKQDLGYKFEEFAGKTLTLSTKINGEVYSGTGIIPTEKPTTGTAIQYITAGIADFGINLNYSITGDYFVPYIALAYSRTIEVEWMKLEVNTEFSGYIEPDYSTELIKMNMTTVDKGMLSMPYTKSEVDGAIDAIYDGWYIYTSMIELNLSGPVTMTDIITAMPEKTELRFVNNTTNPNYVSDVPGQYGFLTVKKNFYVEATWIAVNTKTTVPMYFGSWHSDNGWTGWKNSSNNPNLIINPNFKINQRGLTEYSGSYKNAVDGWMIGNNGYSNVQVIDKGIRCIRVAETTSSHIITRQGLRNIDTTTKYTLSFKVNGSLVTAGYFAISLRFGLDDESYAGHSAAQKIDASDMSGIYTVTLNTIPTNATRARVEIDSYGAAVGDYVDIEWIKVEAGVGATDFIAPRYEEELIKVQSYSPITDASTLISNDNLPRLMNSAMVSNENLLDNPDFSINQRKKTEYTENGYAVDRWQLSGSTDGSFTVNTKILKRGAGANYNIIRQFIDNPQRFANKTVTVTVKVKNATGDWSATLWHYDGTNDNKLGVMDGTANDTLLTFTAQIPENVLSLRLNIGVLKSSEIELEWAKMELGSVATHFVPPHPATEWIKCQRYYQNLGGCPIFGVAMSKNTLRLTIPSNGEMRTGTPTLAIDGYHNSGTFMLSTMDCGDGTRKTFTEIPEVAFNRFESNMLNCTLTFPEEIFTQYKSYALVPSGEFRFYLSADL